MNTLLQFNLGEDLVAKQLKSSGEFSLKSKHVTLLVTQEKRRLVTSKRILSLGTGVVDPQPSFAAPLKCLKVILYQSYRYVPIFISFKRKRNPLRPRAPLSSR